MATHKHTGVFNSKGAMRAHPIERKHKDLKVQQWHDESLTIKQTKFRQSGTGGVEFVQKTKRVSKTQKPKQEKKSIVEESSIRELFGKVKKITATIKKVTGKNRDKEIIINLVSSIEVPIDDDGFIVLDFDTMQQNGIRILQQKTKTINQNFTHPKGAYGDRIERTVGIQIPKDIKLFE